MEAPGLSSEDQLESKLLIAKEIEKKSNAVERSGVF